jgi:hypothetical protein
VVVTPVRLEGYRPNQRLDRYQLEIESLHVLRFPTFQLAPLAQLAEQRTLNPRVRGSSPWRRTFWRALTWVYAWVGAFSCLGFAFGWSGCDPEPLDVGGDGVSVRQCWGLDGTGRRNIVGGARGRRMVVEGSVCRRRCRMT